MAHLIDSPAGMGSGEGTATEVANLSPQLAHRRLDRGPVAFSGQLVPPVVEHTPIHIQLPSQFRYVVAAFHPFQRHQPERFGIPVDPLLGHCAAPPPAKCRKFACLSFLGAVQCKSELQGAPFNFCCPQVQKLLLQMHCCVNRFFQAARLSPNSTSHVSASASISSLSKLPRTCTI